MKKNVKENEEKRKRNEKQVEETKLVGVESFGETRREEKGDDKEKQQTRHSECERKKKQREVGVESRENDENQVKKSQNEREMKKKSSRVEEKCDELCESKIFVERKVRTEKIVEIDDRLKKKDEREKRNARRSDDRTRNPVEKSRRQTFVPVLERSQNREENEQNDEQ